MTDQTERKWLPISSAPRMKDILVCFRNPNGYWRRCIARYVSQWKVESDSDCEFDEYSEENDCYYLQEGWYEQIQCWDDYSEVAMYSTPKMWQPLPNPPEPSES